MWWVLILAGVWMDLRAKSPETIRASGRFRSLSAFTTIYGVGPTTARKLYDIGLRTIEDMERYHDVHAGDPSESVSIGDADVYIVTPNGQRVPREIRLPEITTAVALRLRQELQTTIPRSEVEEIHDIVMSELRPLQSGCVSTIVGG